MLNYDQLETFFYVAECGTFTGAARQLLVSQPAVSIRIKALETQIGKTLIIRSKENTLTKFGQELYGLLKEVVRQMQEINVICLGHSSREPQESERFVQAKQAISSLSPREIKGLLEVFKSV